jgi:hypothetical protein
MLREGAYNADRSLFKDMSDDGKRVLDAYLEKVRNEVEGDTGFPGHEAAKAKRLKGKKRQSEGSSKSNQLPPIETPGLDFGDVYPEGIESQAGGSSSSVSQQRGLPSYGPSPTFFEGAFNTFDTLAAGSSGQRQRAVQVDAPSSTGRMSVTATQQSAPFALEPLGDREIRLLYEGLTHEQRPLQSVSDVATWLEMEAAVDRVRPYVSEVEAQGGVQLQLTDLGKRVLREKGLAMDFDEPGKRQRHALITQPTPAEVGFINMKVRTLRIDGGQDERTESPR